MFLQNYFKYRLFIKRQSSCTLSENKWYNDWQRMAESDTEWQQVVQWMTMSGTTNGNEWQRVVQRVTTSDNKWQWVTASGTTNENDTIHFKEWMTAIKHKKRYTTSRDEWLKMIECIRKVF